MLGRDRFKNNGTKCKMNVHYGSLKLSLSCKNVEAKYEHSSAFFFVFRSSQKREI